MTETSRTYEEVLVDAVRLLTEAARRTRVIGAGTDNEHREPADFAEFLTLAVAGAAANIGGIEALLEGRPGSWEADYVRNMLVSTVGQDENYLLEHRTEPLQVIVNVDDVLNDLGYWQLYEDAENELQQREDAIAGGDVDLDDLTPEQTAELEQIEALRGRLDELREQDWSAYGDAFRANVLRGAGELLPDLPVPVEVVINLEWQNDSGSGDKFGPEERLWAWARDETPPPGSSIPLKEYPAGHPIVDVERAANRDPLHRVDTNNG